MWSSSFLPQEKTGIYFLFIKLRGWGGSAIVNACMVDQNAFFVLAATRLLEDVEPHQHSWDRQDRSQFLVYTPHPNYSVRHMVQSSTCLPKKKCVAGAFLANCMTPCQKQGLQQVGVSNFTAAFTVAGFVHSRGVEVPQLVCGFLTKIGLCIVDGSVCPWISYSILCFEGQDKGNKRQ